MNCQRFCSANAQVHGCRCPCLKRARIRAGDRTSDLGGKLAGRLPLTYTANRLFKLVFDVITHLRRESECITKLFARESVLVTDYRGAHTKHCLENLADWGSKRFKVLKIHLLSTCSWPRSVPRLLSVVGFRLCISQGVNKRSRNLCIFFKEVSQPYLIALSLSA